MKTKPIPKYKRIILMIFYVIILFPFIILADIITYIIDNLTVMWVLTSGNSKEAWEKELKNRKRK